mmetsp:Transcript_78205/g.187506  ORF Transcript_78205/g.187506 Transcript_78205/m.187506 type:complete len:209 (+) Transcript_78205:635-1261(+)
MNSCNRLPSISAPMIMNTASNTMDQHSEGRKEIHAITRTRSPRKRRNVRTMRIARIDFTARARRNRIIWSVAPPPRAIGLNSQTSRHVVVARKMSNQFAAPRKKRQPSKYTRAQSSRKYNTAKMLSQILKKSDMSTPGKVSRPILEPVARPSNSSSTAMTSEFNSTKIPASMSNRIRMGLLPWSFPPKGFVPSDILPRFMLSGSAPPF